MSTRKTPAKRCLAKGCKRPVRARGCCDAHYKRLRKWGDLESHVPVPQVCSIEGCKSMAKARGWCNLHYQRWHKWGDPLADHTPPKGTCTYGDCDKPLCGNGLCRVHYDRKRNGYPMDGKVVRTKCELCKNPHHTKGLCQKHYRRFVKWGDPWFDGKNFPKPVRPYVVPMRVPLDPAPLFAYIESRGGLAETLSRSGPEYVHGASGRDRIEKALDRAKRNGEIDLATADDICCKGLLLHPALIWPEDYWTAEKREDVPDQGDEEWEEAA